MINTNELNKALRIYNLYVMKMREANSFDDCYILIQYVSPGFYRVNVAVKSDKPLEYNDIINNEIVTYDNYFDGYHIIGFQTDLEQCSTDEIIDRARKFAIQVYHQPFGLSWE